MPEDEDKASQGQECGLRCRSLLDFNHGGPLGEMGYKNGILKKIES
jgi:hypothetical protein